MTLITAQRAMLAEIASDDRLAPSSLGMAIYRNAYRARLTQALETSFERTRNWVSEEAFAAAATHYILSNPPQSWTLDAFGVAFPGVLAELFKEDGEVAELAWFEWHLQQAFAAPDLGTLEVSALASNLPDEEAWGHLQLTPAAGFAAREVRHDVIGLWRLLSDGPAPAAQDWACRPHQLVVWRTGQQPHFRMFEPDEWHALSLIIQGATFGAVAEANHQSLDSLGGWLAGWLGECLFSGYTLVAP